MGPVVRKSRRTPFAVWMLALLLWAGCAEEEAGRSPPLDSLYFPTGATLTPAEGAPRRLLVVSGNTDLRFRSGVLHAFDVEWIDQQIAAAPLPADCPPETPACRPKRVESLAGGLVGAVEIGDFGGEIAVVNLGGGQRAFVPIRSTDSVVAVEIDSATGAMSCAIRGGTDCRTRGVRFPRFDPFSVATAEGNVYVGHIGTDLDHRGVIGAAAVDAPMWTGEGGRFTEIKLPTAPPGGLAIGACREEAEGRTCTLFASGRSLREGLDPIFLFDFREGVLQAGPLLSRNVFSQQRGVEARGLSVSTNGNFVYEAIRLPDALATIDVSRVDTSPPPGCVIPVGEELPPEGCEGEAQPLDGVAEPRFVTANLTTMPPGPNVVLSIPRGPSDELVLVTTEEGLMFYDPRIGVLSGALRNLGPAPSAIAWREEGTGVRLYVPSYGRGTLAVVDVPDLFRPSTAQLIAVVGPVQEGGF